jgi:hypothetical protein
MTEVEGSEELEEKFFRDENLAFSNSNNKEMILLWVLFVVNSRMDITRDILWKWIHLLLSSYHQI